MVKDLKPAGVIAGIALIIAIFFFIKPTQPIPGIEIQEINTKENLDGEQPVSLNNGGLLCPESDKGYCMVFIMDKAESVNFQVLGKGYAKDKNHVYYYGQEISDDPENFKILNDYYGKDSSYVYSGVKKILGANPRNFTVLANPYFSKDNEFLYYQGEKNPVDVDINTFTLLANHSYAKDENHVYYGNVYGFQILNEADPSSFKIQSNSTRYVAMDSKHVFYWNEIISEADPATAVLIGGHYFKDKNNVYYGKEKIPGADPTTFEFIYDRYGKDVHNIYMDTRAMTGVDVQSFKPIDGNYFKDKNHVYGSSGKILENVDPATITPISSIYKDKNHVYNYQLETETFLPYDSTTFEIIKSCDDSDMGYVLGGCWAKDKNGVYYVESKINDADPVTFSVLGGLYSKDKNKVFYENKAINGADLLTFTYFDGLYYLAKDSNAIYKSGNVVLDIDAPSFVRVGKTLYSKDKQHVFWGSDLVPIKNAESSSFVSFGDFNFMGKDVNRIYAYGEPLNYVDAATFKILDNFYAKDSEHVYFIMEEDEGWD